MALVNTLEKIECSLGIWDLPLGAGLQKIFFVRKRQLFEQKLSMKMHKFNYWLTRNKTP